MDIGKRIMELRKSKGLSQEELAEKVGVARQTISKWELGETAPDLKLAKELSNVFNVSLDELANNDVRDILVEKTSNTEKLAGLILKLIKFGLICMIVLSVLYVILFITFRAAREKASGTLMHVSIKCMLHDEHYMYGFDYYENTGVIQSAGGDGYLANVTEIEKYSDVYQALDMIDAYVKNNGGICTKSDVVPTSN